MTTKRQSRLDNFNHR